MIRRAALGLALAFSAALLVALPARGHATLERAEPAPNTSVPRQPDRIRTWFTEPLETAFSDLRVLDSANQRVDLGDTTFDSARRGMSVGLAPDLPPAVYLVQWRAFSSIDLHLYRGSYRIAIGVALPGDAPPTEVETLDIPGPTALGIGVRWASYLLYALLVGLALLRFWLLRDVVWTERALRRVSNLMLATIGLLGVVSILALLESALRAQTDPGAPITGPILTVLTQTRGGLAMLVRLSLLVALFFLVDEVLFKAPDLRAVSAREGGPVLALFGAALAGVGVMVALGSHLGASADVTVLALSALHLGAMAIWIGSVVAVGAVARRLDAGWPDQATWTVGLHRTSRLALWAVALLVVTGLYQFAALAGSVLALLATAYGAALLAKLVLVGGMIGFGAINRFWLLPRLWARGPAAVRRSLVLESGLAATVLLVVAVLTNLDPSRQFLTSGAGQGASVQIQIVNNLVVGFATNPRELAPSRYQVTLAERFQPVSDAERVRLRFRNLLAPVGQNEVEARHIGYGIYVASGAMTPIDGFWEVDVLIERPGQFPLNVQFQYPVGRSADLAGEGLWRLPPLDLVTFGGIGLLLTGILSLRIRARLGDRANRLRGPLLAAAALAIFAGASALTSHAHVPTAGFAGRTNPVIPDELSVRTGRLLYEAHCLVCHGSGGRGDGPAGRVLRPPPADLMLHTPVHSDGELFAWISFGIPGTAMPGYADRLSETERWHLINYLRALTTARGRSSEAY